MPVCVCWCWTKPTRCWTWASREEVQQILAQLPPERVTALFSATMPRAILDIVGRFLREPAMVLLSKPQALTVPAIDQFFYQVPFPRKMDALCRLLDARQAERSMVICATKRMVDEVVERLQSRAYAAEALHGDISQPQREKVLRAFRGGAPTSWSRPMSPRAGSTCPR